MLGGLGEAEERDVDPTPPGPGACERDGQANQLSVRGEGWGGGRSGFMKKVTAEERALGQQVEVEHTGALYPLPGAASNHASVISSGRNLFWRPGVQNRSVGRVTLSEVFGGDSVPCLSLSLWGARKSSASGDVETYVSGFGLQPGMASFLPCAPRHIS